FTDRRLTPRYELQLTDLAGTADGLDSMAAEPAAVNLTGTINNQAPVRIAGRLNPLGERFFADLGLVFTNIEMPRLTPYAGKFIGYTISKGKLNLDLHYRIDRRQLEATNRLFFDQLAFGDAVDSPEAMNLPVKLAISLLQNRAGEIRLNLPVSGDLDDPQFSLGGIVFKMIVNIIAKAVTSPFALLGSVFGGGEDINLIAFAAGATAPDDAGREKLSTLAKALYERPGLKVELAGGADRESDAEALHETRFRRLLQAQKLKRLVKKAETVPPVEEITVAPGEEFTELLWEAYKDAPFKKDTNFIGLTRKIAPAEQEKMLRASVAVTEDDLRQLARTRADAAATFLTAAGPVDAARLFLVDPELGGAAARRVEIRIR
ncbi:MAG: DUF748 domain-containing protein, partial [Deltaproteobacteria bacterium]|nr:DUF748 domain-containing protein [Candidatus Anaeroferrophillacea bacterium]